jgi:alpha-L-fucosidase 2
MAWDKFLFSLWTLACLLGVGVLAGEKPEPPKPASRTVRKVEGWTLRVDDRLLQPPNRELGVRVLKALEAKLADIEAVVQADRLAKLQAVTIVLDLSHGKLNAMQYHPDADWLEEHGYARDLLQCVHIPVAAHLLSPRQVREQPWVVLHELAHAYHDRVLGFDEVRIRDAYERFKMSGHGDAALSIDGKRGRHYALKDHKEFFAEMTEAYFGANDSYPFNRAELMTAEPEIHKLLETLWGPVRTGRSQPAAPKAAARPLAPGAAATLLWYAQPAQQWGAPAVPPAASAPGDRVAVWFEALPVGNGRLGALVFGGLGSERISLNEQTVWTGGPYDPARPGGPEALPEIRRLVFAGKFVEAEELFGKAMLGKPIEQMKYQPLGNLLLEFPGHAGATDYRRQLDLDTAVAGVSYRVGDVRFRREVFCSPVDQVIVVRLTADKPGSIGLTAALAGLTNTKTPGDERHSTEVLGPGQLLLRGKTGSMLGIEGRVRYEAQVRVLADGGKVTAEEDGAKVDGADAVTLLIAAATNFKRYDDLTADPAARVRDYLKRVEGKTFEKLRADHVAEHQRLFRRVRLSLPETERSSWPTDERLRDYDPRNDPQLAALLFQYGRYLLISSSRPGCQPANLQGIWNPDMDPAWEGKFTANINLEMNYWPAEVAGLPECVEPLTQMVKELAETGARVAKLHYGARGWVFHQNTDQWRHAAPMDGATWGTFSVGGAWLCTHLWEHYRFSGDKEYLRDIYPLLKGSSQFFLDTLVEHPTRQWLVTCPSNSPENFPASPGNGSFRDKVINFDLPGTTICAGSTIDMQILRDLFDACIEAGKILDADEEFRGEVARARGRLAPMQIGKRGNLQEWIEDWGDLEAKHRHISHLYGLFPSSQIAPAATPKLAEAAKVSLNLRGDAGTGFGMAWKAACWARLLDGEHALLCLANLVNLQTCPNLFSKCFRAAQVDGAMGATAGVAEMLLQSYAGEIHLLPALPKLWADGQFTGLRARGGFEVDAAWAGGRLTSATIRSTLGGPCLIRADGRLVVKDGTRKIAVERPTEAAVRFESKRGGVYVVTPEPPGKRAGARER